MPLRTERRDHVAVVTLDDEARRNALTHDLVEEIIAAFDDFEADSTVGAVVVTGAGSTFCAGGDTAKLLHYSSSEEIGRAHV